MEKFFHLKENGTTVSTEILAGLTTFFAMAYIIVVNPQILSQTGMPWGGVFLATIIAAIIGTLVMGLFANVPYAQAAGMGLNAFFTYTVCFGLGFSWQQTMCMVFLCGLINILITVTKIRKMIILAIPESLQHAIGGGIGLFVAYVGMLNVGLIKFTPGDPKAAAKGAAGHRHHHRNRHPVRRDHLVQLAVHQRDLLPAAADLRRDLLRRGLPGTVL